MSGSEKGCSAVNPNSDDWVGPLEKSETKKKNIFFVNKEIDREEETKRDKERQRDRETERDRERQRETERDRERQRETETEKFETKIRCCVL